MRKLVPLLLSLMILGFAAPAYGAEDAERSELRECLEEAAQQSTVQEQNQAAADCESAPNLLTPNTGELVWGGIAFIIVAASLLKFGFPALKKGLQARADKIRGDLEGAEKTRSEANDILNQYREQLANARNEANRIIEEANQTAQDMRREIVERAEAEATAQRARAAEEIQMASQQAMAELQQRVGELSINLAEKIVQRNLDKKTQQQLIDEYIESIGAKN